jgi:hypothetical protein
MTNLLANANFSTIPYGPIVRFVLRKGNIVQINSRGAIPVHLFDNTPPKNRLLSKTALTLQTWLNEKGEEFMDFFKKVRRIAYSIIYIPRGDELLCDNEVTSTTRYPKGRS